MFSFKKMGIFRRIRAGSVTGRSHSEREQALESGVVTGDSSKNTSLGSVLYSVVTHSVVGLPESNQESTSAPVLKVSGKSSSDSNLIRKHHSKHRASFVFGRVSAVESIISSFKNSSKTTGDLNSTNATSSISENALPAERSCVSDTTDVATTSGNRDGEPESEPSVPDLGEASQLCFDRNTQEEYVQSDNESFGNGFTQDIQPMMEPKYRHVYFETMYYFGTNPYKTKELRSNELIGVLLHINQYHKGSKRHNYLL